MEKEFITMSHCVTTVEFILGLGTFYLCMIKSVPCKRSHKAEGILKNVSKL